MTCRGYFRHDEQRLIVFDSAFDSVALLFDRRRPFHSMSSSSSIPLHVIVIVHSTSCHRHRRRFFDVKSSSAHVSFSTVSDVPFTWRHDTRPSKISALFQRV
jgi:hypothetical protein